MDNATIEVSMRDLQLLHDAMDRVNAVNRLYPELIMTGFQADSLSPWSMTSSRELCSLRDRVASVLSEANPEVEDELLEVHLQPLRKSKSPFKE